MQRALRSYVRDEVETLAAPEMERLQVERLRAGVARMAQAVPFHAERLRGAGVTPESIQSRRDLARIPFTTRQATCIAQKSPDGIAWGHRGGGHG
jgi:phenylacetate-coenzyme A ligase PaaK-like adenylate-forming protein